MEELELLNKIKFELLEKGTMVVTPIIKNKYTLHINEDDWHKIFKTDEYNKAKNK